MKKLFTYTGVIAAVVILLPLIIVNSCSYSAHEEKKSEQISKLTTQKPISLYNALEKRVQKIDFEEYIKGVVAAEMPADFESEALKAQAVAARTFAWGRLNGTYISSASTHSGSSLCTDYAHCQAWISKEAAMKKWGIFRAAANWRKIEKAVEETRGIILIYDGKTVNALFHSNSGGRTENSEEVWEGVSVPYLRSVPSIGEENAKDYKSVVSLSPEDFIKKLKQKYPNISLATKNIPASIRINGHTTGGRVKDMLIGDISMKGTEFRSLFGLRSANFKIEKGENGKLKITIFGYGHGVGMSQWGANYLASRGGTYDEILKYYYVGVQLTKV